MTKNVKTKKKCRGEEEEEVCHQRNQIQATDAKEKSEIRTPWP
jgi:hypothetical protein